MTMSDTPKKLVINGSFGGFSLSEKAFRMYLDRAGIEYVVEDHPDSIWNKRFKKKTFDDDDNNDDSFLDEWDLERDDHILVSVVEELGSEEASGDMSDLRIVELPADVDCWTIQEYDGNETVHECHRSWS
jgi:hypothetical protein